ncbi:hypothetical protein BCO71033_01928 [Burkholderia contaminans]|uniref:Uncharacterized protein n=1 Tax=Burkholderia contaminans TaxID=488447 RepID=A0A6P2X0S6_9BURK|nr:hypothetical protein BCO71033_01928 [Burkholderia contaminans]
MHRRTGMGRGEDEASKRVGGFYRSAKCTRVGARRGTVLSAKPTQTQTQKRTRRGRLVSR